MTTRCLARFRVSFAAAALGAAALLAVACTRSDNDGTAADSVSVLPFDTARIRLINKADTLHLVAELATKPEQRSLGLMERRHLPDSAGMLFVYPTMQSDSAAFWMFRTRIPLDIAFIDSTGTIRTIQHMVPCTTTLIQGCPTYPAGARFLAALEVNAGYFDRHGVRVRDQVLLADTATRLHR